MSGLNDPTTTSPVAEANATVLTDPAPPKQVHFEAHVDSETETETDTDSETDSSDYDSDDSEAEEPNSSASAAAATVASIASLKKPFVSLVLDASPLFQSLEGISRLADKFYTVPEVVQEIRSSKHREQLANNIYFDLQVREPSAVDMKAVVEFAKKTGDYASLSAPDMKILALTYALEREAKGIDHLHTEPASARGEDTSAEPLSVDSDAVTEQMQSLSLNKADKPKAPARAPVDFDDGWITPSNVAKKNAEFGFNRVVDSSQDKIAVACATGDFAVQNVILQIGLNLADFNGSLIKKVQTSVLRCYSCYHIMTRTDRKFCSECGHSTITRVSASVGEDGELQVHLSKHYKLNLRGTRYSMPKPKGGHKHTNLVVREDQKEYRRGIRAAKARAKNNGPGVFDVDYIPTFHATGSQANPRFNITDKVGYGRKNPNVVKNTGNRKKKSSRP